MLVRRIARPLLAAGFVADGVDAVREPEPHVAHAELAYRRLSAVLPLPALDHDRLRVLVRAHGALTAGAGLALAVGRAPRTAAVLLTALTVPLAVAHAPVGDDGDGRDVGQVTRTGSDGSGREALHRFLHTLSLVGATVLAAVDLEGRPGLAWRASHARVDKAASKEARAAVAEARREVKAALRDARRVAA